MVCCLKAAGQILREFKNEIKLPYNTEFSILLKNLNSVRAQVKVYIDGRDVTEGVHLVINPKTTFELSRYIKDGNLNSGNKFKGIARTSAIERYRKGIGMEDGLIRIEFQFEKIRVPVVSPFWNHPPVYGPHPTLNTFNPPIYFCAPHSTAIYGAAGEDRCLYGAPMLGATASSNAAAAMITVPGSVSNQQFSPTLGFEVEDEVHVMILQLVGVSDTGQQITKPITVKTKPTCTTCGKVNKSTAKFCSECGTSLTIV
jgi:hypothetical protein